MTTEPLAPGKRDPEARRLAILRAAAEIIVTRGPGALTHRAVASQAGVALGSTTQYFASIDELREAAFVVLAEEVDASLASFAPHLPTMLADPAGVIDEVLNYLNDARAVSADIALLSSATTEPRLLELALRWTDKLIDMLAAHIGHDRAEAVATYIDGATIQAGLRPESITRENVTLALTSLAGIHTSPHPTSTTGHPPEKSDA